MGEGVDLPDCECLVYACGGKAEVTHTQAAYRVCTANGVKKRSLIIDFDDRHQKQLTAHAVQRIETYRADPVFDVHLFEDASQFVQWMQNVWPTLAGRASE